MLPIAAINSISSVISFASFSANFQLTGRPVVTLLSLFPISLFIGFSLSLVLLSGLSIFLFLFMKTFQVKVVTRCLKRNKLSMVVLSFIKGEIDRPLYSACDYSSAVGHNPKHDEKFLLVAISFHKALTCFPTNEELKSRIRVKQVDRDQKCEISKKK